MQSGQMDKLDQGRGDLENAKKIRKETIEEMNSIKESLAPVPETMLPASGEEVTDPSAAETVRGAKKKLKDLIGKGKRKGKKRDADENDTEPDPEPADADSVSIEEGDSAFILEGDTAYREDDELYPGDGDTVFDDNGAAYEEYPQGGDELQPPPELPY